jgi:hypothetical protein
MFLQAFYQMVLHCSFAEFDFAEGTNPIRFLDFGLSRYHGVMPQLVNYDQK